MSLEDERLSDHGKGNRTSMGVLYVSSTENDTTKESKRDESFPSYRGRGKVRQ